MEIVKTRDEGMISGMEPVEEEITITTKTVALKIDPEMWENFKFKCIGTGQSAGERLAELVLKDLEDKEEKPEKMKFKIKMLVEFEMESYKEPHFDEIFHHYKNTERGKEQALWKIKEVKKIS